ncbi:hypothetical protein COB72_04480 [bacterium]|nr:MAG: hypothetical protein COB72_04480 [bacterium]
MPQTMPTKTRIMNESTPQSRPLIAITSDLMIRKDRPTAYLTMTYAQAVHQAGGIPVILPPIPANATDLIGHFDAFILSGGDDPTTEPFGHPTHHKSTPVIEARQSFETQLIEQLDNHPDIPVLAICLGMQMLALCRGGTLNQHLPDTIATHALHWDNEHTIESTNKSILPSGTIWSGHRQAVSDPANFRVLATSPDGVIEAFDDPNRAFMLAVQWHPERTTDSKLGQGLFDRLIQAALNKH